jgi:hypothetical protein
MKPYKGIGLGILTGLLYIGCEPKTVPKEAIGQVVEYDALVEGSITDTYYKLIAAESRHMPSYHFRVGNKMFFLESSRYNHYEALTASLTLKEGRKVTIRDRFPDKNFHQITLSDIVAINDQ